MNDAEFEQQKDRVQAMMEKWKAILPLGTWLITPRYHRDGVDKKGHKSDAVATTTPNWVYLHASIDWNMPEVEDATDAELESYVVHEYVHILIDELVRYATRQDDYEGLTADWANVEHVTSTLTLGIVWAHRADPEKYEQPEEPDIYAQIAQSLACKPARNGHVDTAELAIA